MNPKLDGVIFDLQSNESKMMVQFKLNIERCSKFVGSKFKDNSAGAAATIRTRTAAANVEPRTLVKGSSKVNVII